MFHLLLEGSQLKDSRGLNDLVAIKDLLRHLCILWFFVFKYKRILCLNAFLLQSVSYLMSVIDHCALLA